MLQCVLASRGLVVVAVVTDRRAGGQIEGAVSRYDGHYFLVQDIAAEICHAQRMNRGDILQSSKVEQV